jgi:hypothetical protein
MKDDAVTSLVPDRLTSEQERIAAEIVHLLGGEHPKPIIRDRVRAYIYGLIRVLPAAKRFANRQANKAHAEKLIKAIDTLERLMKSAPAGLAWDFFLRDTGFPGERDKRPMWELELEIENREVRFYGRLKAIRNACTRNPAGFGRHHRSDLAGEWCAEYGAQLMEEVASHVRISSSTPESPFRKVSSLLYAAVTGRYGDLERACDQVAHERKLGR